MRRKLLWDYLGGRRAKQTWRNSFSSPEAALLLVSTKNRDLWLLARSNTGSPRFADFTSLCACSQSSLTNLIGSGLNLLCLQSRSKTECLKTWPEVAILGADQKERGLWGREWAEFSGKCHSLDCSGDSKVLTELQIAIRSKLLF